LGAGLGYAYGAGRTEHAAARSGRHSPAQAKEKGVFRKFQEATRFISSGKIVTDELPGKDRDGIEAMPTALRPPPCAFNQPCRC